MAWYIIHETGFLACNGLPGRYHGKIGQVHSPRNSAGIHSVNRHLANRDSSLVIL